MNDNDIIKALGCCKDRRCDICVRQCNHFADEIICRLDLIEHALNRINRQKAEIEALKLINSTYCAETIIIREIAIKEFAVRLKGMSEYGTINVSPWQIDNLVKEMTEEKE